MTCTGGAVNQGSNATITINARSPAATGAITNTAVVDPDNAIIEGNELNNTSALVNTQVTARRRRRPSRSIKTDRLRRSWPAPGPIRWSRAVSSLTRSW